MTAFWRTLMATTLSLAALTAQAQYALSEPVQAAPTPKDLPRLVWEIDDGSPSQTLEFSALQASALSDLQRHNAQSGRKDLQLGVHRWVSSESFGTSLTPLWVSRPDGEYIARFEIRSPNAQALRLLFDTFPGTLVLQERPLTLISFKATTGQTEHWTPVLEGEWVTLEWRVQSTPSNLPTRLPLKAISHLLANPFEAKSLSTLNTVDTSCMLDVDCARANLGPPFTRIENAVARMVYSKPNGTFTCTGTLLNDLDPNTQIPYFLTAHHCIDAQDAADTLTTFWEQEALSCGSTALNNTQQVGTGAALLYTRSNTDATLLRLNSRAPPGAVLGGWNANPLTESTAVLGVHHPASQTKRFGQGTMVASRGPLLIGNQAVDAHLDVRWSQTATAPGSSGSGLFTFDPALGQWFLRGYLMGGNSACGNTEMDAYGLFSAIFPDIRTFLAGPFGVVNPTVDYSGAWYNPDEAGWGLMLEQFPGDASTSGQVFALFFVYDANGLPTWYQFQGRWITETRVDSSILRSTDATWGNAYDGSQRRLTSVGNATLTFLSPTTAQLTYTIPGVGQRTVSMVKL